MKKKKFILRVLLGILLAVLAMCAAGLKIYGPRFGIFVFPPTPAEYAEVALGYMNNGIYAAGSDWAEAKAACRAAVKNAGSYEDTYDALRTAARVAGGKHSTIVTAEFQQESIAAQTLPETSFEDGILYIVIPPYEYQSNMNDAYTGVVLSAIKEHRNEITGVIVDLRNNVGGGMHPMIASLSPFLPDGTLVRFRAPYFENTISLAGGTVTQDGRELISVEAVEKLQVPVAVLQNEWTGSSGEVTLLCFKGLENVRFFGSDSAGYCSANMTYRLYDGALVQLTVAKDVDRLGNEYCEDPIAPDVTTEYPLEEAREWLKSQKAVVLR